MTGVCEDVEPDVLVQGRATSFRGWVLLNEAVISWWGFPAATPGRGKPGVGAPPRPPRLMSPGASKAGGHAFGAMVRRASVFPEHGFRCELTSGHQGLICRIGFPREGALEILWSVRGREMPLESAVPRESSPFATTDDKLPPDFPCHFLLLLNLRGRAEVALPS